MLDAVSQLQRMYQSAITDCFAGVCLELPAHLPLGHLTLLHEAGPDTPHFMNVHPIKPEDLPLGNVTKVRLEP